MAVGMYCGDCARTSLLLADTGERSLGASPATRSSASSASTARCSGSAPSTRSRNPGRQPWSTGLASLEACCAFAAGAAGAVRSSSSAPAVRAEAASASVTSASGSLRSCVPQASRDAGSSVALKDGAHGPIRLGADCISPGAHSSLCGSPACTAWRLSTNSTAPLSAVVQVTPDTDHRSDSAAASSNTGLGTDCGDRTTRISDRAHAYGDTPAPMSEINSASLVGWCFTAA